MSVAESWEGPDGVSSKVQTDGGVRIVLVDGTLDHERQLLAAAEAAGIDGPWGHWAEERGGSPALLFEARDLDLAHGWLRSLRADPRLQGLPALLAVGIDQLAGMDTGGDFDDFVLQPCTPLELRTRIRAIEQRQQAAAPCAELEGDGIQVDGVSREALVGGRRVRLTAREFALLAYLRARRGRVLSRQHLLARVWGYRYHGGPRTVDTHIGKLRLKFGAALPIETVRTNGYRLGHARLSAAESPLAAE